MRYGEAVSIILLTKMVIAGLRQPHADLLRQGAWLLKNKNQEAL